MISFSPEASEHLQRLIDKWANAQLVCRATFADGSRRDLQLQPRSAAVRGLYGTALVRNFDENRGEGVGDPYVVDLFVGDAATPHVTDLMLY
jgi:hypothetical protein